MKTIKNSNKKEVPAKKVTHDWEEYLSTISWQMAPANSQTKERLAIEIALWAQENENAFDLTAFMDMKGIPPKTFYEWKAKNIVLYEAYEKAKRIIGRRRETLAIQRNLGVSHATTFILPQYLTTWKNEFESRAKLRAKEETSPTVINVVMPKFPETEEVPPKE